MNGFAKVIVLFVALAVGNVFYKTYKTPPLKQPPETWWGPGDSNKEDKTVTSFKINIPNQVLEDLKHRLKNAREFTPPLEGIQQQYGINTDLLKEIVDFWLNKYQWREREQFLNQFPQFKTSIQGLQIHFIHVKPTKVPQGVKILPLLLLHGWPGSVREFYELIPLLTTPRDGRDFVFEVIVPSMPGYGFSQGATKPGLGITHLGPIYKNLMKRLGHEQFYAHGGDWGSGIATYLAVLYPENVKGIHLSMCLSNMPISSLKMLAGSLYPRLVVEEKHEHKMYPLSKYFSFLLLEFGYFHLQATKPDTIGVALNDSPVGLAAYIIEKFITWTDPEFNNRADGGLKDKYGYTKLLDNVMIYWVTNSITTSMRLYAEVMDSEYSTDPYPVQVPAACAVFDKEGLYQPPTIFKDKYPKLVQANEYSGGHFAPLEVPASLAEDIWLAVEKIEKPSTK